MTYLEKEMRTLSNHMRGWMIHVPFCSIKTWVPPKWATSVQIMIYHLWFINNWLRTWQMMKTCLNLSGGEVTSQGWQDQLIVRLKVSLKFYERHSRKEAYHHLHHLSLLKNGNWLSGWHYMWVRMQQISFSSFHYKFNHLEVWLPIWDVFSDLYMGETIIYK